MTSPLSRRNILQASGAVLALPWFESLVARQAQGSEFTQGKPPIRMGFFYVPNGVNMDDWRVRQSGDLDELSKTLEPLEPVKQHILLIEGMAALHCDAMEASHEPAGGGILVGQKCKQSEEPEVGGTSIDQVIAKKIGKETPIDSLALGIDPGHRGDHGYSGTYLSHISWRNKTTPAALEINPKQLYERLFQGKTPKRATWQHNTTTDNDLPKTLEESILDLVHDEAKDLQRQLGYHDRQKLEQYLEGLRSVERRIELASRDSHSHHQDDFSQAPAIDEDDPEIEPLIIPEGRGIPSVYADHVNLMLDILTLAFQTDTTRVASFLFSYEKSGRAYPQIGAPGAHHSTSHHKKEKSNLAQLTAINRHHMELFSRMLQRMAKIEDGEGYLIDNVMLCYCSGISDGNKHNHDDLPVLLAGGGGKTLRGGRHLIYPDKTPICNLYVEMAQRMGLFIEQFGDSNSRLTNLT